MTADEALASVPTPIIVGISRYSVQVVDVVDAEDDECKAVIDHNSQTIKIGRDHATAALVVGSLIHEALHAIWDEQGLKARETEERAIVGLERGLVGLLGDNPKLVRWIVRGLKK